MQIPSSRKVLLRKYEKPLFYAPSESKDKRIYAFYLLLRPMLDWVLSPLQKAGLNLQESESEIYLLCARLFNGFNKDKSSIVPYLENQIPWKVSQVLKRIKKTEKEVPSGLVDSPEKDYALEEEYYWKIPDLLLTDRYIGKVFTKGEKYYIYRIIISDDDMLSQKDLAEQNNVSRITMISKLKDIKEVLIENNWR